ncbi:GNAT family N-acetyltransferase [Kitasatospora sp. MAP5-34]|uniref:GNAT family N-acetyltransferase n=1 Tax=Kitasatospora sp. MAP5-34 TaxID=3035102 RepID=UPI002473AA62|nr:GNAT family N-acetyltransferase [Kitasatospora sp. MAP5-34]MDH6579431.1 RimJ/RimL family protein N-acetyltransferase [Kitasatospora sp. MAP5-34]
MNDLLTDRLVLHPFTAEEARLVETGERGPDTHWAPDYPAEGERTGARMFVRACEAVGDPQPFGGYEIRRASDGRAIGGIGFHGGPDEHGAVEVGYGLAESARGQGYAREAVRRMVELAREQGVTKFLGNTGHDNVPSQRVMLAAGMTLVNEDEELKYYELVL